MMIDSWKRFVSVFTTLGILGSAFPLLSAGEKFQLPNDFSIQLSNSEARDPARDLELSWQPVEGVLVYEVEIAEQYHEQILSKDSSINLVGNQITGLGKGANHGAFEENFFLRIIGSSKGNDGIHKVSGDNLMADTMTLAGANLQPEDLNQASIILLKIQSPQWVYDVQKAAVFSGQPTKVTFTGLYPGAPYMARLRAITQSSDSKVDPQSDFLVLDKPVYTSTEALSDIKITFEEIKTHTLKALWSSPENNNGREIEYMFRYANNPEFTQGVQSQTLKTNQYTFENLKPETTLHIEVTPRPVTGKYSPLTKGEPVKATIQSLPLAPLVMEGLVSTSISALGTLTAVWEPPKNHANENIHYKLDIFQTKEVDGKSESALKESHNNLTEPTYTIKNLAPLTSYDFRLQAFPSEGNRMHSPSNVITGSGTTTGSTLESPANFKVVPGIGSLAVSWAKVINNLGEFQYKLLVQKADGADDPQKPTEFITRETNFGPLTDLEKDTEYLVTLMAEPLPGNKGDLPSQPISVLIRTLTDEVPEPEPEAQNSGDSPNTKSDLPVTTQPSQDSPLPNSPN